MSAFLTSLASIGAQAGEATNEVRAERQARQDKLRSLDAQDAYLQLAKQADQRQAAEFEQRKKEHAIIPLSEGRYWDVNAGKVVAEPNRPNPMDTLRTYISKQPKKDQQQLTDLAQTMTSDATSAKEAIPKVLARADELRKERLKEEEAAMKVDPIIAAQIGKPPNPAQFPEGMDDPAYRAKAKQWGAQAELIKTRMASAGAEARGKAYGEYRPGAFITPEGEVVSAFYGDAIKRGLTPYAPGFQAMSRGQQINEMQAASGKLRSAIQSLQPEDAFNAAQVVQLRSAMGTSDPTAFHSVIDNLMASSLNERQQDYVIWLQQMGERVLSLRNVAGMGAGAQDLRAAIQATLPGITSGNKQFALKRLDAVDNQVNILGRGIPRTNINTGGTGSTDPAVQQYLKSIGVNP